MVFIRDQPAKLLIRISKQGRNEIPISRLGKGIYFSSKSTVETVSKFIEIGLVTVEKKGKMSLTKLTKKGLLLCKNFYEMKEFFGEGIICYERHKQL